jgi:hypothetical protein
MTCFLQSVNLVSFVFGQLVVAHQCFISWSGRSTDSTSWPPSYQLHLLSETAGFNIDLAKDLSERFLGIRNKTFVHIDKDRVFDPSELYREADIRHKDIDDFINGLWKLMQEIHIVVIGKDIECDTYTGEDIKYLAGLRDKEFFKKK